MQIIDSPHEFNLADIDPSDTGNMTKAKAEQAMAELGERLGRQQLLMYGASSHSLLIILQGMDTAGKDGTIKHVMNAVNPLGTYVASFKEPTPEDLAHDFLWRVHQRTPGRGSVGIFNRSHYEDVLVVRVHDLVKKDVWERRYEQINAFERQLAANDTIICKFFLHISKDEQKERLLDREKDADKAWKLSVGDWQERQFWDDYQRAYADALGKCGTEWAPWNIVSANKKWYRNYTIAKAIVDRLAPFEKEWEKTLEARGQRELEALRQSRQHEASDEREDASHEAPRKGHKK